MNLTRRTVVFLGVLCALSVVRSLPAGQAEATASGSHGALRTYLQNMAMEQLGQRRGRIAQIQTPEQVRSRQREVRSLLLQAVGGFPGVRSPLNLQRLGTLDRGDYPGGEDRVREPAEVLCHRQPVRAPAAQPPFPAVLSLRAIAWRRRLALSIRTSAWDS